MSADPRLMAAGAVLSLMFLAESLADHKGSGIRTGLVVKSPKWRRPKGLDPTLVGPLFLLKYEEWVLQIPKGGQRPTGNGWYYAMVDVGRNRPGDVRVMVPRVGVLGSVVAYIEGGYEHVADAIMRGRPLAWTKPVSIRTFPLQDPKAEAWAIRSDDMSFRLEDLMISRDLPFLQRLIVGAPS